MHIVFLTPGFPENEQETYCLTYLQNFVKELHQTHQNIKLSIITLHYPFIKKQYIWNGIQVYSLGGKNRSLFRKPFLWRRVIKVFQHIKRQNEVDIIHSFWLKECALVGNYLHRKYTIPHFSTAMGTEVIPNTNKYLPFLGAEKMNIVATSDFQRQQLQLTYPKLNSTVISFGLLDCTTQVNSDNRTIDILSVGSINQIKNIALFLDILEQIKQIYPTISAMIIGEDHSNSQIEQDIKKRKLDKNIQFMGRQDNSIVKKYMSTSKVLLHTSNYESQGYVFLEGLQAGMQIVSRAVGIAKASNKWFIAHDLDTFVQQTLIALQSKNFESTHLYPIQKTVSEHLKLWNTQLIQ